MTEQSKANPQPPSKMWVMLPAERLKEIREHAEAIVKLIPKRRVVVGAKVLAKIARRNRAREARRRQKEGQS